jgi:uncharacterized protein DUF3311
MRSARFIASFRGGAGGEAMNGRRRREDGWSWWYLLFIIQFVAVLWPPFYNKAEPAIAGMPFFYWYQLLWVIIGAILTAIVYFVTEAQASGRVDEPFRR